MHMSCHISREPFKETTCHLVLACCRSGCLPLLQTQAQWRMEIQLDEAWLLYLPMWY